MLRFAKIFIVFTLCGYASLAQAACWRQFSELVKPSSVESLRQRFAFFREIGEQDNIAFRAMAEKANLGKPTEMKLSLDLENAVMKDLNDKIVNDKDIVTALVNFHKTVFWSAIESDPVIQRALIAKYSDPKSIRLAFNTDSPELIQHLKDAYARAGAAYEHEIASIPDSKLWFKKTKGIASTAFNWHLSGHGPAPDMAGAAARDARTATQEGERAELRGFQEAEENLLRKASQTDLLRKRVTERWASVANVLTRSDKGNLVLSFDAINTIRKATPKGPSEAEYIAAVQEDFFARFRTRPSKDEVLDFRDYLAGSDAFSPGIYIDRRVEIELGKAQYGIVSVDLKAQNARNIEGTMKALADTEGASIADRLIAVRAAEAKVTSSLDRSKRIISNIGEEKGGVSQFTGDDGAYFPDHELTQAEKRTITRRLSNRVGLDRTRLVFLPTSYWDSGRTIPAERRSEWIVAGEDSEKKLQKELLKIFGPKANQLTLAMDIRPTEAGRSIGVYIALPNRQKPSAILLSETQRILTELGWKVRSVQVP